MSAELIILIAAVLSVALILVVQLQKTAKEGRDTLKNNSQMVFDAIDDTVRLATVTPTPEKKDPGESCSRDSECKSSSCVLSACE